MAPGNFLLICVKEIPGEDQVAQKFETTVQLVICLGFPLVCMENINHDAKWRFVEQGPSAKSTRAELLGEFDGHCERRLSSTRNTQHVYVRNESERLFIGMSFLKDSKADCAIFCEHFLWRSRCAKGMVSAVSERTQASPIQRRQFCLI